MGGGLSPKSRDGDKLTKQLTEGSSDRHKIYVYPDVLTLQMRTCSASKESQVGNLWHECPAPESRVVCTCETHTSASTATAGDGQADSLGCPQPSEHAGQPPCFCKSAPMNVRRIYFLLLSRKCNFSQRKWFSSSFHLELWAILERLQTEGIWGVLFGA